MNEKIRFGDLSGWLKTLVVFGWIALGLYVLIFLTGFIIGFMGG